MLSEWRQIQENEEIYKTSAIQGFSAEEIEELERDCGFNFPAVFRDYIGWLGKTRHEVFSSYGYTWAGRSRGLSNADFRQDALDLLGRCSLGAEQLPARSLVLQYAQGNGFIFFVCDGSADPPVHYFDDSLPQTELFAPSVSELIRHQLGVLAEPKSLMVFRLEELESCPFPRMKVTRISFQCPLDRVPEAVFGFENLTSLDLRGKDLSELDSRVFRLRKLETLNLFRNSLEFIPEGIAQLESLRYLYLRENSLSSDELEKVRRLLPNCQVDPPREGS